jgi:hypothetical protein
MTRGPGPSANEQRPARVMTGPELHAQSVKH